MSKIKFTSHYKIIFAFVLTIFVALTTPSRGQVGKNLKAIEILKHFPGTVSSEEEEPVLLNDTIAIFYLDNYVVYRLQPVTEVNTFKNIKGTEPYFIYHDKDKYGFLFESLKDPGKGQKFLVDTFLSQRGLNVKPLDVPDSVYFLSKCIKDKSGILLHKYASQNNKSECCPDSIYYYFSTALKSVPYTISPKLDSIEKMKLYRYRIIFNQHDSQIAQMGFPKEEISLEIRKFIVPDPKKIIDFIEKFKTQIAKEN